jgi:diadenosine tetraphosphate (Ap4A) HIT family hydrolase
MEITCIFCNLLRDIQSNPTFIAKFDHSVALLNFDQKKYPGQSLLILKDHYDHLHSAPVELLQDVVPEISRLTTAILKAFGGFRANHMSLGNQVTHVHWHVVPRYPNDLNAGGPPTLSPDCIKLNDSEYIEMANRIRLELQV